MTTIFFTLMIMSSIALIGTVLLQNPKGKSLAVAKNIGARQSGNLMTKSTWILSIGTFGLTLILSAL